MKTPKLILLNGFAGSGKTTLTSRYLDEHPLALGFEGDVFITMIGSWKENWHQAAELKLLHSRSIVERHLQAGYDVMLPFLIQDEKEPNEYQKIAQNTGADFYEIYLELDKHEAITRLFERGRWGEEGSDPLTEADRPKIETLYDLMERTTGTRPNTIRIRPVWGKLTDTYEELLRVLGEA